jgi:hypothetical protein
MVREVVTVEAPVHQDWVLRVVREAWGGEEVVFVVNPDRPGTILIMPRALMAEIFRKGWIALS